MIFINLFFNIIIRYIIDDIHSGLLVTNNLYHRSVNENNGHIFLNSLFIIS